MMNCRRPLHCVVVNHVAQVMAFFALPHAHTPRLVGRVGGKAHEPCVHVCVCMCVCVCVCGRGGWLELCCDLGFVTREGRLLSHFFEVQIHLKPFYDYSRREDKKELPVDLPPPSLSAPCLRNDRHHGGVCASHPRSHAGACVG